MDTDKDINHTLDSENRKMESATKVTESIDIIPFVDHVYVDMKLWGDFVRACRRKDVDVHEYMAVAVKQEIENALKYDLI